MARFSAAVPMLVIYCVSFSPMNVCVSSQGDADSVVGFGFVGHYHNISSNLSRDDIDSLAAQL